MHFEAVPMSQKDVNAFIDELHRHHQHTWGDKFRLGAEYDGKLVGVVQVERPVARMLDDGYTLEVTRLCTDGTRNACSFLYSKAAKIAKELGYRKIITYILETEDGASLEASGFAFDGFAGGGDWSRPSRPRETTAPTCRKKRYIKILKGEQK